MMISPPSAPPSPCFLSMYPEDFAAQVLASWHSDLAGTAFAVVRQTRNGHKTLVHSCSMEASHAGVEPGMPLPILERRFPGIRVMPREERLEGLALEELSSILYGLTPDFRLKEDGTAMVDLTGTPILRQGPPEAACEALKARIRSALGFRRLAFGIAASKVAAQVMARKARPEGVLSVLGKDAREALAGIAPSCLPGLSPRCREAIRKYAISNIGQLIRMGREVLVTHFGREGEKLYAMIAGLDVDPVAPEDEVLDAETCLQKDIVDLDALHGFVRLTADQLVFRMRKTGSTTNRFTLEIQYADGKANRKSFQVPQVTQAFPIISEHALKVFGELATRRVSIKVLRLTAKTPKKEIGQQDLFQTGEQDRSEAIGRALDRIRSKHSFGAVLSASNVERG